jgi:hypothetical protein
VLVEGQGIGRAGRLRFPDQRVPWPNLPAGVPCIAVRGMSFDALWLRKGKDAIGASTELGKALAPSAASSRQGGGIACREHVSQMHLKGTLAAGRLFRRYSTVDARSRSGARRVETAAWRGARGAAGDHYDCGFETKTAASIRDDRK